MILNYIVKICHQKFLQEIRTYAKSPKQVMKFEELASSVEGMGILLMDLKTRFKSEICRLDQYEKQLTEELCRINRHDEDIAVLKNFVTKLILKNSATNEHSANDELKNELKLFPLSSIASLYQPIVENSANNFFGCRMKDSVKYNNDSSNIIISETKDMDVKDDIAFISPNKSEAMLSGVTNTFDEVESKVIPVNCYKQNKDETEKDGALLLYLSESENAPIKEESIRRCFKKKRRKTLWQRGEIVKGRAQRSSISRIRKGIITKTTRKRRRKDFSCTDIRRSNRISLIPQILNYKVKKGRRQNDSSRRTREKNLGKTDTCLDTIQIIGGEEVGDRSKQQKHIR